MKNINLIIIIMVAVSINATGQQRVLAGSHGKFYHAYQPNIKIYCFSDTTSVAFDINSDHQEDLEFKTIYSPSSFASYSIALNYNSDLDLILEQNDVAKLKSKDTIQSILRKGLIWSNASQSIFRETETDQQGAHSSGNWFTSDDGYLGFRLRSGTDTLYGWFNLSVSAGIMYVKEISYDNSVTILGTKKAIYTSNDINLYPNPCNDSFTITGLNGSFNYIEIFNNTGTPVMNVPFENNKAINCEKLIPGIYLIKISGDNEIRTSKIYIK